MGKEILKGWQNTDLRVYEVTGIERGRGIHIKDIFDNNEIFVNDIRSSRKMTKWDIGAMRVIKTLGDSIEFQSESKQYPDLSGRKNKNVKSKTQQNELDEPVREMLRKKFLEYHYRKWVDMPISSLGGMTPREASKTDEGKAKLNEVLKVLENAEERRKRSGEPSYDVNKLRQGVWHWSAYIWHTCMTSKLSL